MNLSGKRVLITGGTKGIGAATAALFAAAGADVAINGRHDDPQARAVLSTIAEHGQRGHLVLADVARPGDCERCVAEAIQALGGLEILVHSAGDTMFGSIDDLSPDDWHAAFDVHVHAAYHLCRHSLPSLRANRPGTIVLVSSVAGIRGCPRAIAYGAAKGAVLQFTRMLARDLADDDIRVNCVAPGVIDTRLHAYKTPEQWANTKENRIPLHRVGTPDDVAEAIQLLVTNDFITGECIVVDGGTSMQITR